MNTNQTRASAAATEGMKIAKSLLSWYVGRDPSEHSVDRRYVDILARCLAKRYGIGEGDVLRFLPGLKADEDGAKKLLESCAAVADSIRSGAPPAGQADSEQPE
jgi:hypothetical protein